MNGFSLNLKSIQKIQVSSKLDKNDGAVLEDLCTFVFVFMISLLVLLRIKNISGKNCTENQNTSHVHSLPPKMLPFMIYCGKI